MAALELVNEWAKIISGSAQVVDSGPVIPDFPINNTCADRNNNSNNFTEAFDTSDQATSSLLELPACLRVLALEANRARHPSFP